MSDITTIYNIIPKSQQNFLLDIVTNIDFDWHYLEEVTYEKTYEGRRSTHGFGNVLYNNGRTNQYTNVFYPILLEYLSRENLKLKELYRMRLGFLLNTVYNLPSQPYMYNNPHIDFEYDHMVALYYLNDCDGDTYIFNETEKSSKYTIKQRITPEKGKLICFDGKHYHASGCPKVFSQRLVLTMNFSCEKANV
jgi:hypothetical protein